MTTPRVVELGMHDNARGKHALYIPLTESVAKGLTPAVPSDLQQPARGKSDVDLWLRKRGKQVQVELSRAEKEELQQCFAIIDADGSGSINTDELQEALKYVNITMSRQELDSALKMMDSDGSGQLDMDEFISLMSHALNPKAGSTDKMGKSESSRAADTSLSFPMLARAYRRKKMMEVLTSGDVNYRTEFYKNIIDSYEKLKQAKRQDSHFNSVHNSAKALGKMKSFVSKGSKRAEVQDSGPDQPHIPEEDADEPLLSSTLDWSNDVGFGVPEALHDREPNHRGIVTDGLGEVMVMLPQEGTLPSIRLSANGTIDPNQLKGSDIASPFQSPIGRTRAPVYNPLASITSPTEPNSSHPTSTKQALKLQLPKGHSQAHLPAVSISPSVFFEPAIKMSIASPTARPIHVSLPSPAFGVTGAKGTSRSTSIKDYNKLPFIDKPYPENLSCKQGHLTTQSSEPALSQRHEVNRGGDSASCLSGQRPRSSVLGKSQPPFTSSSSRIYPHSSKRPRRMQLDSRGPSGQVGSGVPYHPSRASDLLLSLPGQRVGCFKPGITSASLGSIPQPTNGPRVDADLESQQHRSFGTGGSHKLPYEIMTSPRCIVNPRSSSQDSSFSAIDRGKRVKAHLADPKLVFAVPVSQVQVRALRSHMGDDGGRGSPRVIPDHVHNGIFANVWWKAAMGSANRSVVRNHFRHDD